MVCPNCLLKLHKFIVFAYLLVCWFVSMNKNLNNLKKEEGNNSKFHRQKFRI